MASRRTAILNGMGASGGTETSRRKQIREALGKALKQPTGPGGQTEIPQRMPPPKRFPQVGGGRPEQNTSLNAPVKLGAQLQGRMRSGAINQAQAQKTARQRQTLKKAFGSDWRSQVYAGSGVKEIRQGGPFANRQIAAERAKGLQRAKRKLY